MATKFTYSRRATPAETEAIRKAQLAKRAAAKGAPGERGERGPRGLAGMDGADGADGWNPLVAVTEDGERRVLEIVAWTGGTGTPPDTGYLGEFGTVEDISDAVDVRGAPGADGRDGDPGADGADGADIFTAPRDPNNSEGKAGDIFINVKSGDLWKKGKSSWALQGNLRGPRGFSGANGSDGTGSGSGDNDPIIFVLDGPPPNDDTTGSRHILVSSGPPT